MISHLKIKLHKNIEFTKNSIENISVIEDIRNNIIRFSNNEPENIMRIINNMSHELSYIIYARPYQDTISIYGLLDEGKNGINAIFKNIILNKTFKIKDTIYEIIDIPTVETTIDLLPYNNGRINTYVTTTPINIFNKYNHKVFKAILHKHFKDGKFDKTNLKAVQGYYEEIKKYTNEQIKDFIAYMVSKLLKKNKSYFEFINNIKIEWETIKVVFHHYHSEEKKMPMIIGKFKSNFVLPKFVGYKIGKGFGEINLKDTYKNIWRENGFY